MRTIVPYNNVSHDYEKVLKEFLALLKQELGMELVMVYLTGSYARGDATNNSDLDIFCIFNEINRNVLEKVGYCARNTSIAYEVLEINTQSMSVEEYRSKYFEAWSEYAVTELNSVLLYGEELYHVDNLKDILVISYKKSLADILMGIRHYICVDEPQEKLTHRKITTYILKPLMFALRQERYCKTDIYPLTNVDLLNLYADENKILVEYFLDKDKFESDIMENHKAVLFKMHNLVEGLMTE